VHHHYIIRELRNYDADAEDNFDLKMNLYLTNESRDILKSFSLFPFVKTFEIQILKIIHRGSRSPHNAEFGHFTLLFYRGRERNVPRIIEHVHSYCSAH